ncbi:MAG TPA: energy transducer TonB [Bryobacteraceae bacterium]|nr:energy transducer TonB [Bryobacteraceae bacterium]
MRIFNSQALSLALHAAAIGILLFVGSRPIGSPVHDRLESVPLIAPYLSRAPVNKPERSGGSNRTSPPARHGAPPPMAHRTFIPPNSVSEPKLPQPITVAFDSPTIEVDPAAIGDPNSRFIAGAFGMRGHNGIGDVANRGGIGPSGSGPSGITSNIGRGAVTPPRLIYQVEPEFSEEARKAKYQGTVVLAIEVDTSGRPANIRVLQGLGLGLDEKAVEAVLKWRFKPALRDGKPVTTAATVQVTFRLL